MRRLLLLAACWCFLAAPCLAQVNFSGNVTGSGQASVGPSGGTVWLDNGFESGAIDAPPWQTDTDPDTNVTTGCALVGTYGVDLYYHICGPPKDAPTLSQVVSGSLGARTYYVKITYASTGVENGQTTVSPQSSLAIDASKVLKVTSPPSHPDVDGYFVYASTVSGSEKKQNATKIAIGTDWQEPDSGLIDLGDPPSTTTGCRAADGHQDDGCAVNYQSASPGQFHFFLRTKFKLVLPEAGAYQWSDVARKIVYLLTEPTNIWSLILSVATDRRMTFGNQTDPCGGSSWSWDCGTSPSFCTPQLNFDQVYTLEIEIQHNTATGSPWNGVLRIWLDGVNYLDQTAMGLNLTCTDRLRNFQIGSQVDRLNFHVVNEHRCHDAVKISDSYIGP